ncbi:hypothetical protein POH93_27650, partial [Phytobacter diazotrophicus]|nr:hypothetical protein [Phytobacter diazotrophicus]MDC0736412.1 hypothetical protein [Phytobacter diazotrophicus]
FGFAENTDDLFVGKTLLHGDVLMWLMKTLLTSGCTNQRGAGQVRHPLKIASKTLKSPDWFGVSIRRYGDNVELSANINARSMRMDNRHSGGFFHGNLLAHFR